MSVPGEVIRIAAQGDGVTASGEFVRGSAPGDMLLPDGSLQKGPHHVAPPCRHFGDCGGCALQQIDEQSLAEFVRQRAVNAASSQDLQPRHIAPVHLSPPFSRRRAQLQAMTLASKKPGASASCIIGFRSEGSSKLVDLQQCDLLEPQLFALLEPLRALLSGWGRAHATSKKGKKPPRAPLPRQGARPAIEMALIDQGVVLSLKPMPLGGLEEAEALSSFARENRLARLTVDYGMGPETLWEPEPATVMLGGVPVVFPEGAFLQATKDGEEALVGAAREWLAGADSVADLFAGLGSFAFPLASNAGQQTADTVPQAAGAKILAAEASMAAHLACQQAAHKAGLPITCQHRDLYRNPLTAEELSAFDGAVLDPPRAGARAQIEQMASSSLSRLVYISCNPSSWARDAAHLIAAGFKLQELRPVGQFRWSTHIELASYFTRSAD